MFISTNQRCYSYKFWRNVKCFQCLNICYCACDVLEAHWDTPRQHTANVGRTTFVATTLLPLPFVRGKIMLINEIIPFFTHDFIVLYYNYNYNTNCSDGNVIHTWILFSLSFCFFFAFLPSFMFWKMIVLIMKNRARINTKATERGERKWIHARGEGTWWRQHLNWKSNPNWWKN